MNTASFTWNIVDRLGKVIIHKNCLSDNLERHSMLAQTGNDKIINEFGSLQSSMFVLDFKMYLISRNYRCVPDQRQVFATDEMW